MNGTKCLAEDVTGPYVTVHAGNPKTITYFCCSRIQELQCEVLWFQKLFHPFL